MKNHFLKQISSFVAFIFVAQQAAFAAPMASIDPAATVSSLAIPAFPESIAKVDDVYTAPGASKTFYLLQDAHTNESGQFNLVKTVDHILQNETIQFVFTEAGQGDDSLSFLKEYSDRQTLETVGKQYVQKGFLQGSEYLSLTGDKDFVLWGVENRALYNEAVQAYRKIYDARHDASGYLRRVERALDFVKSQVYGSDLMSFDRAYQTRENAKGSASDYVQALVRAASAAGVDLNAYPHLSRVQELQKQESAIDFQKAGKEQEEAVVGLSEEDREVLDALNLSEETAEMQEEEAARVYYSTLSSKVEAVYGVEAQTKFPELSKYFVYLKHSTDLSVDGFLNEQTAVEKQVFEKLVRTQDEKLTHRFSKSVNTLIHLFEIQMTPDEYFDLLANPEYFDIKNITGYVNRKIADLKSGYDKLVFLDESYDQAYVGAKAFYDLTFQRDAAFVSNAIAKMDENSTDKAVLVTGGFHTVNLKEILKQLGISYVSVAPEVTDATNHERYEQILLSGEAKDESLNASSSFVPMMDKDTIGTETMLSPASLGDDEELPVYDLVEAIVTDEALVAKVKQEADRRIGADNNIGGVGMGASTSAIGDGGRVLQTIVPTFVQPVDDKLTALEPETVRVVAAHVAKRGVPALVALTGPGVSTLQVTREANNDFRYALSAARLSDAGTAVEGVLVSTDVQTLTRVENRQDRVVVDSSALVDGASRVQAATIPFALEAVERDLMKKIADKAAGRPAGNIIFYLDGINEDMVDALLTLRNYVEANRGFFSVAIVGVEDAGQIAKLNRAKSIGLAFEPSGEYDVTTHLLPSTAKGHKLFQNAEDQYRGENKNYVNIYNSLKVTEGYAEFANLSRHALMAVVFGQYGYTRLDNLGADMDGEVVGLLARMLGKRTAQIHDFVAAAGDVDVVDDIFLKRSEVARFTLKILVARLAQFMQSFKTVGMSA